MLVDVRSCAAESRDNGVRYHQVADRACIKAIQQRIDAIESIFWRKRLIYAKGSLILILRIRLMICKRSDGNRFERWIQESISREVAKRVIISPPVSHKIRPRSGQKAGPSWGQ
jgi:hypothetical protein